MNFHQLLDDKKYDLNTQKRHLDYPLGLVSKIWRSRGDVRYSLAAQRDSLLRRSTKGLSTDHTGHSPRRNIKLVIYRALSSPEKGRLGQISSRALRRKYEGIINTLLRNRLCIRSTDFS